MYNLTRKTNINNNKNANAIKYKNNKQKGTKKLMIKRPEWKSQQKTNQRNKKQDKNKKQTKNDKLNKQ